MLRDIFTFIDFLKYRNKTTRIFFFENNFIEGHLAPYINKNKNLNQTIIVSLYEIKNEDLKKFKIFQFKSFFFLNLFFLTLKIKYCYSSTPDLDNSAFQRSVFKKTKYVYIQHSPLGLTKIYRDNAFNNFDVVQIVNSFQKKDLQDICKIKNKKIKGWRGKYLFLSKKHFKTRSNKIKKKKILLAPTWGTDFFDLNTHLLIKKNLNENKYDLFIRPHNMSILKKKISIDDLKRHQFQIADGNINFSDFNLVITDWSGIYIEFAKVNKIKSILIQNKEKILNDKFYEFKDDTIDSYARKKLGKILTLQEISSIENEIDDILSSQIEYSLEIEEFFEKYFY